MIRGLIRLALYFGFGVLLFRFVNRLLINAGKQALSLGKRNSFFRLRKDPKVIDLCPHCGSLKDTLHRCS